MTAAPKERALLQTKEYLRQSSRVCTLAHLLAALFHAAEVYG